MPALSNSELGIVLFILLLVVAAGKLARWAEALGSYFYQRSDSGRRESNAHTASPHAPGSKSDPPNVS
jgi:hypothetical protein